VITCCATCIASAPESRKIAKIKAVTPVAEDQASNSTISFEDESVGVIVAVIYSAPSVFWGIVLSKGIIDVVAAGVVLS
jgi:hypothetical protein